MTREEALQILDTIPTIGEQVDALELAIKALEQELRDCKTCIHSYKGKCAGTEECHECMWESKYEQEPCEDCDYKEWLKGEIEPFINKPCVSSGVCEHDKKRVLDKIRAEIEFIPTIEWKDDGTTYILASYFKKQVLEIIDKYKAESEE